MNFKSEPMPASADVPVQKPYEKPELQRIVLALAETLGSGCKLVGDSACVGPPLTAFDGGS